MKPAILIFLLFLGFILKAQEADKDSIIVMYQLEGVTINGKVTWKKGDKILLENLIFRGGTSFLEVTSKSLVDALLYIMQENPKLKIEIQGHICCYPDRTYQLSKERAQVVCEYLEDNGISKSRLRYKDFGGRKPIYPIPEQNEEQRIANRRVEIKVLEN